LMTRRAVPASAALAGVPGRGTVLARPIRQGWTMMGRPAPRRCSPPRQGRRRVGGRWDGGSRSRLGHRVNPHATKRNERDDEGHRVCEPRDYLPCLALPAGVRSAAERAGISRAGHGAWHIGRAPAAQAIRPAPPQRACTCSPLTIAISAPAMGSRASSCPSGASCRTTQPPWMLSVRGRE